VASAGGAEKSWCGGKIPRRERDEEPRRQRRAGRRFEPFADDVADDDRWDSGR
jgi:hypothetical protein